MTLRTKHRLPLLVERTVANIHALRLQVAIDHQRVVNNTTSDAHSATTCTKGCSNCCHHPFFISIVEGILLYRHLATRGLWVPSLQKRLRETRDRTLGTAYDVWLKSNIPCSLLEDNLCLAYEARPLNCRMTYAISNPQFCHPHELGPHTRQIPRAEELEGFNK